MYITAPRIVKLLYALSLLGPFKPKRFVSYRRSAVSYAIAKTRALAE